MSSFEFIFGKTIEVSKLKLSKSKDFIRAVELNPFVKLVEAKNNLNLDEAVIIDVQVEVPQICENRILSIERIGVVFDKLDQSLPNVLALRKDFPQVPHLNLTHSEIPKSLCLYEEPYEEVILNWTAVAFLERIRNWLRLTAKGKLHADDQPLEPLLPYGQDYIVLQEEIFSEHANELLITDTIISENIRTIIARRIDERDKLNPMKDFVVTLFIGKPQTHGIISHYPGNFKELNKFFIKCGLDLASELKFRLRAWKENYQSNFFDAKLILILIVPKKRTSESEIEEYEKRVFILEASVKQIGSELGIWSIQDGNIGLNIPPDESKSADNIGVTIINYTYNFSEKLAGVFNDYTLKNRSPEIILVGAGSLGSQIYNILVRHGLGKWTVIDNDILLPHNLARHTAQLKDIGSHKAKILAEFANELFSTNKTDFLLCNILKLSDTDNKKLMEVVSKSEIILDISASIPVARFLCLDLLSDSRRISCFFTINGKDSVIIAEDLERKSKLDALEMQYYRGILHIVELNDHLIPEKDRIRYGTSCRDISAKIPYDLITQHSGVCSSEIKNILENNESRICVWRSEFNYGIKKYLIKTYKEHRFSSDGWTIVFDDYLVEKIMAERESKLPNETGGALIGSYDHQRKIIYVVDSIMSPSDSVEWPTVYIRGIKGLKKEIERIEKVTDNMLYYIGEWHSHPKGYPPIPSQDDYKAFLWLTEVLNESGLLSLMLIVGDDYKFYLGKMIYDG